MRRRFVLAVGIVAAIGASGLVATAHVGGAQARAQSGCTPTALTPIVQSSKAFARGEATGCTGVQYSWQINLSTTTGQVLATNFGTSHVDGGFTAPAIGSTQCIGYHVYSWVSITVGGVMKTDSSGSVNC